MAQVNKSVATLRLRGDDLIPEEISALLGYPATHSQTKGQIIVGQVSGKERVAQSGMWRLKSIDSVPENLDQQIVELLSKLNGEIAVWRGLRAKYQIDLFCGLFMRSGNEGLSISPQSLLALGERGIELGLDIYCHSPED